MKTIDNRPRQNLSQGKKARLFLQYQKMAFKLANGFSAQNPHISLTDFEDEALSLLGQTVALWGDPSGKGYVPEAGTSPQTWLYRQIFWGLGDFVRRGQGREHPVGMIEDEEETRSTRTAEAKPGFLGRFLSMIGDDAKTIIETILFAPADIIDDIQGNAPVRTRRAVEGYFEDAGWDKTRFARAWAEAEAAL